MSTAAIAAFLLGVVAAVGLRALPRLRHRPAAEILVDLLYRRAQRAYASAVAADRALVAYRTTRRQAERDTVREYCGLAANSAEPETPAAALGRLGLWDWEVPRG